MNVHVMRDNEAVKVIFPPGRNPPEKADAMTKKMKRNLEDGSEFKLTIRSKFDQRAIDVAYLKAAYLAGFAKFGYRFILCESMNSVRNQIREPETPHADLFRIYLKEHNSLPDRLLLLTDTPYRCLFVKIGTTAVLLPWINGIGSEVFTWLADHKRHDGPLSFNFEMAWDWPSSMEMILDKLPAAETHT